MRTRFLAITDMKTPDIAALDISALIEVPRDILLQSLRIFRLV